MSWNLPVDFLLAVINTTIGAITISFLTVWLSVNIYNLYPIIGLWVDAGRQWGNIEYVDGRDELDRENLPTIDVLMPAYHESRVIKSAIRSIRQANYPQNLIRIIVLTEPDDGDTNEVLQDLAGDFDFHELSFFGDCLTHVVVPDEYPGQPNKPRALNFGFQESYSEIVGVLDAEDIADPDLFHTVAGAIEGAGYDYVQGRLDMANEDDGWLNTLFRGEYGFWYNIHLPAYYHAGYPIPLGGTTNFCRRSVLSEISEIRKDRFGRRWEPEDNEWLSGLGLTTEPIPWDPLNVTEDFELGFLLWLENYDLALIDIDTCEESPTQVNDWIRQRTRWQKGKVFTMLMYLKHPPENLLARFHILFQSALPHLGPVNVSGITIISLFAVSINFQFDPLLFGLLMLGLLLTIQYMIWQAIGYWIASDKPMRIRLPMAVVNAITLPAYWVLQWGADIRALWQVYRKDLDWEKTPHTGEHLGDGDN